MNKFEKFLNIISFNEFKQLSEIERKIIMICLPIIFLSIVYINIKWNVDEVKFKNSEKIYSNCIIKEINFNHYKTIGLRVDYEYYALGKKYENQDNFLLFYVDTLKYILKNKILPIAYSKDHPELSKILLNGNSLEKYNLKQPDSMNWINKYESHIYNRNKE